MTRPTDLIARYLDLFQGRPDTYAVRREWDVTTPTGETEHKVAYVPTVYTGTKESSRKFSVQLAEEIGTAQWGEVPARSHIYGETFLGIYPLHADSTVKLFALDFDGDSPEEAFAEAKAHYDVLAREAGLPVYLETSQSGNGYHIWGFLESAVDALTVRRAVKQFINQTKWFDRMFPNQSTVTVARPYGNLIALPLHAPKVKEGKNCFIDPATARPVANQTQFLMEIEKIPAATIRALAAAAPELPAELEARVRGGKASGDLWGGPKLLDERFGCEWVRWCYENPEDVTDHEWYALACNLAQLQTGRDLFHEISEQDARRYSPHATDAKFDQAIEKNAPHTHRYIRENLRGTKCTCETRFPGRVPHPFDLAKVPVMDLMALVEGDAAVSGINEGIQEALTWAEAVTKDPRLGMGIPTGIACLDDQVGFRDDTLNILVARPSIGKSAVAMDIAFRLASMGVPVYFFSLEMSRQQLWRRMLSRASGVSATKIRKGTLNDLDWRDLKDAQRDIADCAKFPLFIEDSTRNIGKITEIAYRLKEEHGHGVVMIDYLGLLDWEKGENEYAGVTRNSKESKKGAKATHMPFLVLHQLNRSGEDTGVGAEVSDTMLRSSGQIEQDADVIMFLLGERGQGIKERELVKSKDRDGEAGVRILMEFNPMLMQFDAPGTWYQLSSQSTVPDAVAIDASDDLGF